ncbi:MAG: helix-turn-helix transcriptional regulator [Dokdonella sp.]
MSFTANLSDSRVLESIGERISRRRLDRNLTQAELATAAGVSKRTIERLEAGESTQLTNFVRILRALELLPGLDALIPAPAPSPLDQLKLQGRQRQRASSTRESANPGKSWSWNDEQ